MKEITRIAPSPTGDMHLGTARTAYFNYLAARSTGGEMILRIDDTDINRNNESHVDVIYKTMDWLGLEYDKVVRQSDRLSLYLDVANSLINANLAKRLEGGAICLNPLKHFIPLVWKDEIAGNIFTSEKDKSILENFILIKSNGFPSYNFATAVDDLSMGVNHVIRGHDHISNTVKQLFIMYLIESESLFTTITIPKYTHVGLIFKNKKKLSKRDNAASMLHYKDKGVPPGAMLNFMLRLGWAETNGKTIKKITKEHAISIFYEQGKMRNQPSNMDENLLNFYIKQYSV